MRIRLSPLVFLLVICLALPLGAQTVINVPPDPAPAGVDENQTLNLFPGGQLRDDFYSASGSTVNIFGGRAETFNSYGTVHIRGGSFGDDISGGGGSTTIYGADFRLDGEPIWWIDTVGDSEIVPHYGITGSSGRVLTGTLMDGTPFAFHFSLFGDWFQADVLRLTHVEVAAATPGVFTAPGGAIPLGIREGQQLIVNSGGQIPTNFNAGRGSETVINGGVVGKNFEAAGAAVTINGGTIGEGFDAFSGSTVTINGGDFGREFSAFAGSMVTVNGGSFDERFAAYPGSTVVINGGEIREKQVFPHSFFRALGNSTVTINGGEIADIGWFESGSTVTINGGVLGDNFSALRGSEIVISGGEIGDDFVADGAQIIISGGVVGDHFDARAKSNVAIHGGVIGQYFSVDGGTSLAIDGGTILGGFGASDSIVRIAGGTLAGGVRVYPGADFALQGSGFRVDGRLIEGLSRDGDVVSFTVPEGSVLSGVLADGSPFAFADRDHHPGVGGDSFYEAIKLVQAPTVAVGPALISLPNDSPPRGLREGQRLVVNDNGRVPDHFGVDVGGELIVDGGQVGANLEAVGATVRLARGSIGEGFDVFAGSHVVIEGGEVGLGFEAFRGSQVLVQGGTLGSLAAQEGSAATIQGGAFRFGISMEQGAKVAIAGGSLGDNSYIYEGAELTLHGAEFRLDGELVPELSSTGQSRVVALSPGAVLSGVLADGTPFAFSELDDDILKGSMTMTVGEPPPALPVQFEVPADSAPRGLHSGQSLALKAGGALPDNFNAAHGSAIAVEGGVVGKNLELDAAALSITSGLVGEGFDAFNGSSVTISGGELASGALFASGSSLVIHDGLIGSSLRANQGSITVNGGRVGGSLFASAGSMVVINDGIVGQSGRIVDSSVVINGGRVEGGLRASGEVTLNGGSIGHAAILSGEVTVNGATIGHALQAAGDITVASGSIGNAFLIHNGSNVQIFGGAVGSGFTIGDGPSGPRRVVAADEEAPVAAASGATVELFGGSLGTTTVRSGSTLNIWGGSTMPGLQALPGSAITLFGGSFWLDGVALSSMEPGELIPILERNVLLSGVLRDGSTIRLELNSIQTAGRDYFPSTAAISVAFVPEAASAWLAAWAAALSLVHRWSRWHFRS